LSALAASGARLARLEAALAAALAAFTLACFVPQLRFFFLPNNDFGSFEAVARSFGRLELPTTYQRLPLLPAVMALLAPLLPGRHALLDAALLVNAACAAATLPLLYAVAAGTLGRGALLVPVLFAGTAQFHAQGLQPLVEPSLGLFVVLAFLLFQRRSPWQYAAAAAAALSRYEAALLLAIFAAANAAGDRRFRRHGALAALAGAPFALWLALGALRGSGAAFYAADMERMGFAPAPHVLATLLKEAFRGWWSDAPGPDLPLFLAAVGVPCAAGVASGLRRFPRESAALLAYLAGSLAVIVALGIDKARYVYPVVWIPQLFFAAGLIALLARARDALARRPWAAGLAIAAAIALPGWLAASARARLAAPPESVAPALDLAYLAALALLAAIALVRALGASGAREAAAACIGIALAAVLPLLASGMRAKAAEQVKIRFANYGTVVAARWLEQHLAPGERVVAMGRQHFLFLTGWEPARVVPFYELEAGDAAGLAAEMRARGLHYLVATWRKPVAQAIDRVYERKYKWFLVDPFTGGAPVTGFEHVAALPLPEPLRQPPVQVYRVVAPREGGG
jgi:hypothetical protein